MYRLRPNGRQFGTRIARYKRIGLRSYCKERFARSAVAAAIPGAACTRLRSPYSPRRLNIRRHARAMTRDDWTEFDDPT
jgi:hypothetical protein